MHREPGDKRRWAAPLFAAAYVLLSPQQARAGEGGVRLEVQAPHAGCPSREQTMALIVARLGFDPFTESEGGDGPTLRIATEKSGDVLRVRVERLEGGSSVGERVLTSPRGNCAELIASAALAASILVDPTGELRERRLEPQAEPRPVAASNAHVGHVADQAPPAVASPKVGLEVKPFFGAYASGNIGFAPSASLGVALTAGARFGHWRIGVEGRADLPASSAPLRDGTVVSASLLLVSLVPCYARSIARLCLVATLGSMRAETVDAGPVSRDSSLFGLAGARGGVEVPLGRTVSLTAHVEGLVPLRRLTIRARGNEAWTAPLAASSLGLGFLVLW
jgi:hypothetical protein